MIFEVRPEKDTRFHSPYQVQHPFSPSRDPHCREQDIDHSSHSLKEMHLKRS